MCESTNELFDGLGTMPYSACAAAALHCPSQSRYVYACVNDNVIYDALRRCDRLGLVSLGWCLIGVGISAVLIILSSSLDVCLSAATQHFRAVDI